MLPEVEDLVSEYAMIASVAECSNTSTAGTNDNEVAKEEYGLIKNLYDIRGYCHFDLPFAQFKINHFEETGLFFSHFYVCF